MLKFILLLLAIALSTSVLIQLDKQLIPVSDLTAYTFKALINNKVHDFHLQTFKSAGGYVTEIWYGTPSTSSTYYNLYKTPIHGICDPDTGILSVLTCDSKRYNFYNCTGASYINGTDPLWTTWNGNTPYSIEGVNSCVNLHK